MGLLKEIVLLEVYVVFFGGGGIRAPQYLQVNCLMLYLKILKLLYLAYY